ncbi:MAG: hypothetical protein ACSHX3_00830 [Litorimonas sp.]
MRTKYIGCFYNSSISRYTFNVMKHLFGIITSFTFLVVACTSNATDIPDKTVVHAWGIDILNRAISQTDAIAPSFFDLALIPADFDYSNVSYVPGNPNSPTEVTTDNIEFLRNIGIVSALLEYCELPWDERNFLPMMQWQRALVPEPDRYGLMIAKIGTTHGYAMGITGKLLNVWQPDCARLKSDLEGHMFADVFAGFELDAN